MYQVLHLANNAIDVGKKMTRDWITPRETFNTTDVIVTDPGAKVIPGIYIGSLNTITSEKLLNQLGIDLIINMSNTQYTSTIPVVNLQIDDVYITSSNMSKYTRCFSLGLILLIDAMKNNKTVLVHCAAGVNRSATLIMFYLIETGMTFDEAYKLLYAANKKRNTVLLTNPSFVYLLRMFDVSKNGI